MGYILRFADKLLTSETSFEDVTYKNYEITLNYKKKCYHIANDNL